MKSQAALDAGSTGISATMVSRPPQAVHDGAIIGSPETVAERFNEIAGIEGTAGIMLTFDDFLQGTEIFGSEVMPLLR
jgi:pyrimidine oxygenase